MRRHPKEGRSAALSRGSCRFFGASFFALPGLGGGRCCRVPEGWEKHEASPDAAASQPQQGAGETLQGLQTPSPSAPRAGRRQSRAQHSQHEAGTERSGQTPSSPRALLQGTAPALEQFVLGAVLRDRRRARAPKDPARDGVTAGRHREARSTGPSRQACALSEQGNGGEKLRRDQTPS